MINDNITVYLFHWYKAKGDAISSVSQSVQSLSRVRLFATPWIAARQASLSITNSQSSLRLASIELKKLSHLILLKKRLHFRVLRKESLEIPWPHPTTCEPIRSQIRISWLYVQDLWPAREIRIKPGKWEPIRTHGQPGKWKPIRTQHLTLPQNVTN